VSDERLQNSVPCYLVLLCGAMFDYKFASHAGSTEYRIPTDELSQVRLLLALLASLIKLHIDAENVGLRAVCCP
jgi:hypothetical protein